MDTAELIKNVMREDVSSSKTIDPNKIINNFRRLSNEYMQKSEHYRGMALAYATAADSIMLTMEEGDSDAES